jgi:hypothetical protein
MDDEQKDFIAALMDKADEDQERASQVITQLEAVSKRLQQEVREAAATGMQEALQGVHGDIGRARNVVIDLQRFSLWRAAWQHAIVSVVTIAIAVLAVRWYVPQPDEMKALRAERDQLQASIEDLSKRGARIVMTTCGKRLCIEASTDQGKSVIDWSRAWYADGVPLVIPKGY